MPSSEPAPPNDDAHPHLVLAGGGTGGHLFPMLAVAEQLGRRLPDLQISALCSDRSVDARILGAARINHRPVFFQPVPAAPLKLTPRGLIRLLGGWGKSVRTARTTFHTGSSKRIAVLTTSGFVAPPIVRAARTDRVPVLVMNLDDPPGKATRWIARMATLRLDATLTRAAGHAWKPIPPILRKQAIGPAAMIDDPSRLAEARSAARCSFGLEPSRSTLLVLGGSQGAKSIDAFLGAFAQTPNGQSALHGWQVLHQAHADTLAEVRSAYDSAGVPALVVPFIETMGLAWSAADLAITRAGAGCVAEVHANRVPAVFMPYPHHRDQHQARNAQPLVEMGLAVLFTDRTKSSINLLDHGDALAGFLTDPGRWDRMRSAVSPGNPNAGAEQAADALSEWLGSE